MKLCPYPSKMSLSFIIYSPLFSNFHQLELFKNCLAYNQNKISQSSKNTYIMYTTAFIIQGLKMYVFVLRKSNGSGI